MNNNIVKNKVKKITLVAMFSAIAFILMSFEFSVPFMPAFIKMDFSDMPELLCTFMLGAPSGVAVCLIKNLLHLIWTQTAGVGELSNFLLGAVLCIVSGGIYHFKRTRAWAALSMLIGSIAMGVIGFATNALVVYPFYYNLMPKEVVLAAYQALLPWVSSVEQSLLVFNVPFTILKGLICSALTFVLYKKLKKVLRLDKENGK